MAQFGIMLDDDHELNSSESDVDSCSDGAEQLDIPNYVQGFDLENMSSVLTAGSIYNCFDFMDKAEELGYSPKYMEKYYDSLKTQLDHHSRQLLDHSQKAFIQVERVAPEQQRDTAIVNGEVVSESESDNPDDYSNHENITVALRKKIKYIRLKCRRIAYGTVVQLCVARNK